MNRHGSHERRSKEEILQELLPKKSSKAYEKTWQEFLSFAKKTNGEEPGEEDILQYIEHLRKERKFLKSSLWTRHSHLNSGMLRFFGKSLRDWPAIKMLIKSYPNSIPRQAMTFTTEEIQAFLKEDFSACPYFLLRQAVTSICFCGGLRICEAKELKIEDLEETEKGYYVSFRSAKEKQMVRVRRFLIPSGMGTPYKEKVDQYLKKMKEDTQENTGPLFRGCPHKKKYIKQPLGKTLMAKIPHEVAKYLHLKNPGSYTGHSFRRTSATSAAANDATTTVMMSHFGWADGKTALGYIDSKDKNVQAMAEKILGEKIPSSKETEQNTEDTSRQSESAETDEEIEDVEDNSRQSEREETDKQLEDNEQSFTAKPEDAIDKNNNSGNMKYNRLSLGKRRIFKEMRKNRLTLKRKAKGKSGTKCVTINLNM